MAEVLKHALKNLCTRTGWCYAVLWKLKRRSRMVLTWEDGLFQASNLEGGTAYGQIEHQINLAVVKMSFHVYSLGEGIIGRVAFTGKHQWIYGNQRQQQAENAQGSSDKYPDGWSNQFAAGINTIAVVAVPQGVVQLGSIQVMPEDLNMVGQIRALFGTLQSVPGAFVSDLTSDGNGRPSRASSSTAATSNSLLGKAYSPPVQSRNSFAVPFTGFFKGLECLPPHDPSAFNNNNQATYPGMDQKAVFHQAATAVRLGYDSIRVPPDLNVKRPRLNHHMPDFHNHGSTMGSLESVHRNAVVPSSTNLTSTKLFSPLDIPGPDSFRLNNSDNRQFNNNSNQNNNNSIWSPSSQGSSFPGFENLPQLGDETTTTTAMTTCLLDSDEGYDYNSLFKALQKDDLEEFNGVLAALSKDCGILPLTATNETETMAAASNNFAFGDELSEVLALLPKNDPVGSNLNVLVSPPPLAGDVKPTDTNRHIPAFELPSSTSDEKLPGYCDILGLNDNKLEPLLDAIVAGASMSSSPCSKPGKESPKHPADFTGLACDGQPAPNVTTTSSSKLELVQVSEKPAQQPVSSPVGVAKWSSSALQMKAAASSWTSETTGSHHANNKKVSGEHSSSSKDNSAASKKPDDPNNTRVIGRKRLRPGETPRPRPKDRQQIQDRVRELRDIVPNATKCSIDSLLEKTIKHMQFLQTVTQHGDKWKAGADTKVGNMYEENQHNTTIESGATWAMEVGPKGPSPVSVVENLRQPGQMLVEMLCEEKGLFWEIADKIRGLGLTILKGVMESRNDKVWARFNVEMQASCGVNRCKVLWNLVQLLEPNSSSKHNGGGATTVTTGTPAASFTGSEVTDVCSESFSGFQTPSLATRRGITVSSNGW